MIASGRVAYLAWRAADYGVHVGPVSVDLAQVRQRKRAMVARFRNNNQRRIESTPGLDLLFGEASFSGPKTLAVCLNSGEARQISADLIFINTGARPTIPAIAGIDRVPTLNSTTIMELDCVPEHLLVLSGGSVGIEFGQLFRRFGSRVTIMERGKRLLGREDDDVADAVANILRQDGIEVLLATEILRVALAADGTIDLKAHADGDERVIIGTHLLAAIGRTPNTERLNLPAAGVPTDGRGYIRVNERLGTKVAQHLRTGRGERRASVHSYRLRRFPNHPHQPD
jgi:pyruvate/2-oxoglutarate dehydrogenase complex dihydrolipoamide dehydrogenase (E3) component